MHLARASYLNCKVAAKSSARWKPTRIGQSPQSTCQLNNHLMESWFVLATFCLFFYSRQLRFAKSYKPLNIYSVYWIIIWKWYIDDLISGRFVMSIQYYAKKWRQPIVEIWEISTSSCVAVMKEMHDKRKTWFYIMNLEVIEREPHDARNGISPNGIVSNGSRLLSVNNKPKNARLSQPRPSVWTLKDVQKVIPKEGPSSLFIFRESNPIRKYAKLVAESKYPFIIRRSIFYAIQVGWLGRFDLICVNLCAYWMPKAPAICWYW